LAVVAKTVKVHLLDVGTEEYGDTVLCQLGDCTPLIDGPVRTVICIDQSSDCGSWVVLLPIGPLAAIIVDDAFLSRAAP
jgi:hypothetical protein